MEAGVRRRQRRLLHHHPSPSTQETYPTPQIIIHHISESSSEGAEELASSIRSLPHAPWAHVVRVDIATPSGPGDIINHLKSWRDSEPLTIDILVNNAGIAPPAALADITIEHFSSVIATNLQAPLLMAQAAAPYLVRPARIINISSLAARQAFSGLTVYAASKAGLEAATRHLAHEMGSDGTTVNCVTPGAVESELLRETEKKIPGIIDAICARTPLQNRVGNVEEFSSIVAWLCRPEAGWMTGQTISATGGQAMY